MIQIGSRGADADSEALRDLDDFVNCYFGSAGSAPATTSEKGRVRTRPLKAVKSETTRLASNDKESTVADRRYSGNRHERKESERFKSFTYEDLIKRDKHSIPSHVPGFPRTLKVSVPPAVKLAPSQR